MRKIHNYKNLDIWKLGMEIAFDVSDILLTFPDSERYGLRSQMSRSSVSIPSNIAEGSSRTDKSFLIFLDYALGSSFELETQFRIAQHRNYLSQDILSEIEQKIARWQKMTRGFKNRIEKQIKQETE